MSTNPLRTGKIPYLDGVRGCSVLAVVFLHAGNGRPLTAPEEMLHRIVGNGGLGVDVFFVISGFLITSLLLREWDLTERISLRAFYARRVARILPAAYVYLVVIGLLCLFHVLHVQWHAWLAAATFVWNYGGLLKVLNDSPDLVVLTHFWSLSMEEQFYLLWPSCLLLLGRTGSRRFAIGVILAVPVLRIIVYHFSPDSRPQLVEMFHTGVDQIIWGAWVALAFERGAHISWDRSRWLAPVTAVLAALALVIMPGGLSLLPGMQRFVVPTVNCAFAASLIIWLLCGRRGWVHRALEWRPLCWVGVLSYSLYLWQEVFVLPTSLGRLPVPLGILCAFAAAVISYYAIESPLRRRLQRLLHAESRIPTRATAADADPRPNPA